MFGIPNTRTRVYADYLRMATLDICVRFGRRLQSERRKKNMKQIDLSVASDLTRSTISQIENGRQEVGLRTLEKLAKAFDVTVSQLTRGI